MVPRTYTPDSQQNLTNNIFRFDPSSLHPDLSGMSPLLHFRTWHTTNPDTVNEHISIDAVAKAVQFYTNLIIAANHEHF